MKIRLACADDISELAKLDQDTNLTYWSEFEYQSSFDNKYNKIYILEGEYAVIVGCIVVSIILDQAEVLQFWIAVGYKKLGYGEFLLGSVMKKLTTRNHIEKIFLEVVDGNVPAIGLYLKLGFEVCGKRKNYYKINSVSRDAVLMSYTM